MNYLIQNASRAMLEKLMKLLSHVWLFVTPWTVARQTPLSMGFTRQEYWSGLPCPSPGDLPDPGIEPGSSALQPDTLLFEPLGKSWETYRLLFIYNRTLKNPFPVSLNIAISYPPKLSLTSWNTMFSHPVIPDSLQPHGLQHARPPCLYLPEFAQVHVHCIDDTI